MTALIIQNKLIGKWNSIDYNLSGQLRPRPRWWSLIGIDLGGQLDTAWVANVCDLGGQLSTTWVVIKL